MGDRNKTMPSFEQWMWDSYSIDVEREIKKEEVIHGRPIPDHVMTAWRDRFYLDMETGKVLDFWKDEVAE